MSYVKRSYLEMEKAIGSDFNEMILTFKPINSNITIDNSLSLLEYTFE